MGMRKIFVLLTRFTDRGAKALRVFTRCAYTHASIGLEEDMNTFYSFVGKGFLVEKITRYLRPDRAPFRCQLYQLEVTEKVYQRVKQVLECFVQQKDRFAYSRSGVVLSVLGLPYPQRRHHYFCSNFVAVVLKRSGAVRLKKSSANYLPRDFRHLPEMTLRFQGDYRSMLEHFRVPQGG